MSKFFDMQKLMENVNFIELMETFRQIGKEEFKGEFPRELIEEKNYILRSWYFKDPKIFKSRELIPIGCCRCFAGIVIERVYGLKSTTCPQCKGVGIRTVPCKICRGLGKDVEGQTCKICRGSGRYVFFKSASRKSDKPCPKCGGNGKYQKKVQIRSILHDCPDCDGVGIPGIMRLNKYDGIVIANTLLEGVFPKQDYS